MAPSERVRREPLRHAQRAGLDHRLEGAQQIWIAFRTGFAVQDAHDLGAVSYTHLDVYKRQLYSKGPDWQPHIVSDGLLITGQNPASSVGVAQALLERLKA